MKSGFVRVFSGLADHYSNTSLISLSSTVIASPLLGLAPSSCLLRGKLKFLRYFLKGSSGVTYPFYLLLVVAKGVQLFSDLGSYSGIFAIYSSSLCSSNKSTGRTANVVLYALCLLYVLCTASLVVDLVHYIVQVSTSNNPIICKNIIFIICYAAAYFFAIGSTSN